MSVVLRRPPADPLFPRVVTYDDLTRGEFWRIVLPRGKKLVREGKSAWIENREEADRG